MCLITKDPQREYKDLLKEKNIKGVTRVRPPALSARSSFNHPPSDRGRRSALAPSAGAGPDQAADQVQAV